MFGGLLTNRLATGLLTHSNPPLSCPTFFSFFFFDKKTFNTTNCLFPLTLVFKDGQSSFCFVGLLPTQQVAVVLAIWWWQKLYLFSFWPDALK